ncbi:MAG TPA: MauE/DoxX family redox-associated membrane protein [Bryobacteraceae bacterium]|nr:MauE/DoxX family redox-associated membrane protein [Bryobacteraceae bacterium]
MAHPRVAARVDSSPWKPVIATTCAVLLALLFLVAGLWKTTDPFGASARLAQAKVPGSLSLAAAVLLGTAEVFSGVLLLIPRFRRWGAWLTGAMLIAFMIYIGVFYNELRGEECQCFPWLKRSVGPGFFVGDGVMVLLAVIAGLWSRPSNNLRTAAMILGAVGVFAGASYGVNLAQNSGAKAPPAITVDGKRTPLDLGRVFLYFFDPECMHCDEAARRMAKHNWKDTTVIGIATRQPQFAAEFMQSTKLKGGVSPDVDLLKGTFPFGDPPYGVALEHGRQKAAFPIFDKNEPEASLRKLGFID